MFGTRLVLVSSQRCLHTTRATYGFESWFKSFGQKKEEDKINKTELKVNLNNVEKFNQEAESLVKPFEINGKYLKTEQGELEIIGNNNIKINNNINKDFKIRNWINHKKIQNSKELDEILLKSWNFVHKEKLVELNDELLNKSLNDLNKRFSLFKNIQSLSGYKLSDLLLTEMENLSIIKNHFVKKIFNNKIDEKYPNALLINEKTFSKYKNVEILSKYNKSKVSKRYNELLKESELIHKKQLEKMV